jgi:peptide/nickel transport system permease protein
MTGYFLNRLLSAAATILGIVTVVFFLVRLIPGDPAQYILGDYATPDSVASLRHAMGLDQSLAVQYGQFLAHLARGDMGESVISHEPVMQEVFANAPPSVALALAGIAVAAFVGIPLGVWSAVKRGTAVDVGAMAAAIAGISFPSFWIGLLAILLFSHRLGLFPSVGAGEPGEPLDQLHHLVLPAVVLGLSVAAIVARLTRSAMLEVLGAEFIRAARAKGLSERAVVWGHALRNAMVPILAVLGVTIASAIGNAILIEVVFSRPGLGSLVLKAVSARDYPLVQATVLVLALAVVVTNTVVDVMYGVVDPRVRSR